MLSAAKLVGLQLTRAMGPAGSCVEFGDGLARNFSCVTTSCSAVGMYNSTATFGIYTLVILATFMQYMHRLESDIVLRTVIQQ